MDPAALIYLERDADAQRLVVAWPLVFSGKAPKNDAEIFERWSQFSGIREHQTKRLGVVLRAHDICQDGGKIDDVALRYVRSIVAKTLPKRTP